jgi:hypothetical protein
MQMQIIDVALSGERRPSIPAEMHLKFMSVLSSGDIFDGHLQRWSAVQGHPIRGPSMVIGSREAQDLHSRLKWTRDPVWISSASWL